MRWFWIGISGFLIAIFAFNAAVDVSGVDSFARIYSLSRLQGARDLMVWDEYFDQRPWLKARLDDAQACPQVLVLGSSTVGTMSGRTLGGRVSFVNGWLTSGGIEDLEAVTEIMEKSKNRPEAILLGVDPWFFNERESSENWRSLLDDYVGYQRAYAGMNSWEPLLQAADFRWQVFKERLNFATTLESARFAWHRWHKHLSWSPMVVAMEPDAYCRAVNEPPWIRAGDGHYHICRELRGITEETIREAAENYVAKNTHFIRDWNRIDSDRMRRLRKVVSIWRSWNRRVILVAPPMHPTAYRKITEVPEIRGLLGELDAELGSLAEETGAEYLNLRDPAVLGCGPDQFRDGHHSNLECADRMVAKAVSAAGLLAKGSAQTP